MADFLEKLKSDAGKIAKETDEVIQAKRIEMQIDSITKQIEDKYRQLGQMTYVSNVGKEPENPAAAGIIVKITELKQLIVAREARALGKKFCTNCGKENDADNKFCATCGTKMG